MSNRVSVVDERLLAAFEQAFGRHAGANKTIDLHDLQKALGLQSRYLASRVFAAFDANGDGAIDRVEFLDGVRAIVSGTEREKLAFAFRVHDHDGDGLIDRHELLRMIAISLAESDVARVTQPPEQLTSVLLAMADVNDDGKISFEEFQSAVMKRPELISRMTRNEAVWILPNEDLLARIEAQEERRSWSHEYGGSLVFGLLWIAANGGIFAATFLRASAGPNANTAMQIGRACGSCIAFNAALILLPMMRGLLARLRASWLGRILPVDDAIAWHRSMGHALLAFAIVHSAAFVQAYVTGHPQSSVAHLLLATARGITGASLVVVLLVMWIFALAPIRRSRRFELFYFTHLSYVAWFALLIAHAPAFLLFGAAPLVGFGVEQWVRRRRRRPATFVTSSIALRSGVTRVEVARPPGFVFGAGDYAFLRLPWIAKYEWHPFTISSAPERDTLTFHIRSLGNWTASLRRQAERQPSGALAAYVDGPYGSPSARIFNTKIAVLIGAGIGVTPFASVLESIVLGAEQSRPRPSHIEAVHFFWLNRDQYSFEWFVALLAELEATDTKGLLDIHLCMTGGRAGVTAMALELAREMLRAAGRSDLITGLRTKTHLGPPNWELWLSAIAKQHAAEKVDVFFCGPSGLAKKLRPLCLRLGMAFRHERF